MATRRTSCHSRRSGPKGFAAAVTWRKRKNGVRGPGRRKAQRRSPLRCSLSSADPASPTQRAPHHFCPWLSEPSQHPRSDFPPPPQPQMPMSCSSGPAAAPSALPCQPGTAGKGLSQKGLLSVCPQLHKPTSDMGENGASYNMQAVGAAPLPARLCPKGEKDALAASLS